LAGVILSATAVWAGEVPLPERKPRDKTGAPAVTNVLPGTLPSKTSAGQGSERDVQKSKSASTQKTPEKPGTQAPASQDGKAEDTAGKTKGAWPKTLDDAKAEADAKANPEPVPTQWPDADIAAAKAQCAELLKSIQAVTLPEAPFRDGDCGAAAPVRLISIGRNPEVAISPPPVVTCEMVHSLHTWVTGDLQALARKHLGGEIIKIENMSDYSCRNAYGRTKNKLSEHGRANALDIRGFITARGETATVLDGWDETERDVAERKLAEQQAKADAAAKAAAATAEAKALEPSGPTKLVPAVRRSTIVEGTEASGDAGSGETGRSDGNSEPMLGYQPSRLGGPKDEKTTRVKPVNQKQMNFLKSAHSAACRIFGTTLGPEANNAHRNHFHVDMAERRSVRICE